MQTLSPSLLSDLSRIQEKKPVILNLTNFVAMDFTANALLAVGASPLMSEADEEISELLKISDALVINLGTLSKSFCRRVNDALQVAKELGKPVVLDPVGAGASALRTDFSRGLLGKDAIQILRANASEILSVLRKNSQTRGVDSLKSSEEAHQQIDSSALPSTVTIVISGATDFIVSRKETASVSFGDPLMTQVTAMGCTSSALCAAFLAVNSSSFHAANHAMTLMGLAGEQAKENAKGPGSFKVHFIDSLFQLGRV